jgi:hypothetical protein
MGDISVVTERTTQMTRAWVVGMTRDVVDRCGRAVERFLIVDFVVWTVHGNVGLVELTHEYREDGAVLLCIHVVQREGWLKEKEERQQRKKSERENTGGE